MKKEREKRWEKIKEWLKTNAPKALDVVGDVLPDRGVAGIIKNLIDKDPDLTPDQKAEFARLSFELEAADRKDARDRQVRFKVAGGNDWMMWLTGCVGLFAFLFMIYAVVYIPEVKENDLFVHFMGIIEGVVVGNIFAFYYGTSVKKD